MQDKVCAAALSALLLGGCYTTAVGNPHAPGRSYDDRQWFTLFGLVQLSDEAGRECAQGVAYVESKQAASDVGITIGLWFASALVGAAVCELPDNPTGEEAANYSSCVSAMTTLGPAMLASRTVEYRCVEGAQGPGPAWMPGGPADSGGQP